MLVYGQKFGFDIYCISDVFRAIIINEGITEVIPANDSKNFSLALFPLGSQSSNIKTDGEDKKISVGLVARA